MNTNKFAKQNYSFLFHYSTVGSVLVIAENLSAGIKVQSFHEVQS